MSPIPRYLLALSLIVPLALIAASCSSSDSADPQPTSTSSVASVSTSPMQAETMTTTSVPTPTTQESQMLIDSIATGGFHSCALMRTGSISCWGSNLNGQLGNGLGDDFALSAVPMEVVGIDDATAVAEGGWHTCALRRTGEVFCWGSNWDGQLGNGKSTGNPFNTSEDSPVPIKVLDKSDVTAIEAGGLHTCALHQDGTITCWGSNTFGELGNGQSTGDRDDISADSAVPVKVIGISDATAVAVGGWNTCALHQDSTVSCWGSNTYGELGNGQSTGDPDDTSADSAVPVKVTGISDATAIAVGGWHVCALHQTGEVSCWGRNRRDELGNGQTPEERELSDLPVKVVGISDATAVTAGGDHTCALHQDSTITCWGSNTYGELGNGQSTGDPDDTSADSPVPVKVVGISNAMAVSTGGNHGCALLRTDEIACWGDNRIGQLGNGESTGLPEDHSANSNVPVKVIGLLTPTVQESQNTGTDSAVNSIGTGGFHSCALMQTGSISCWGSNINGQLGNGELGNELEGDHALSAMPVKVLGISDATAVALGGWHTCALRRTGDVFCWGANWDGQLGNGKSTGNPRDNSEDSPAPVKVLHRSDTIDIKAGGLHTCALHQDGTITCWGSNSYGELGNGQSTGSRDDTSADSSMPVKVIGISDATAIAVGGWNTCALHQDGTISCWGSNSYGELGNGRSTGDTDDTSEDSAVPVKVTGISDATAIAVGGWHVCALHQDGTISCWGSNSYGELGSGLTPEEGELSDLPVKVVGISDATTVTAGGGYTCALHQDGTISCWGGNSYGELGNGQSTGDIRDTSANSAVPVKAVGISNAMAVSTGGNHGCALLQTDEIACWGDNRLGQLGNGESTGTREDRSADSNVPVKVIDYGG